MPEKPLNCIAILGPTCSSKSAVAMRVAETLGGEIVSCDSMQVYRGMNIGTAKPTPDEMRRVPHHLVDILDLQQPWDANRFVQAAETVLAGIAACGHPAILAGGTGLYARALIYGFSLQPSDPAVFAQVCREYEQGGEKNLKEELLAAGGQLHPDILKNWRRLVRAVEILRLTGGLPRSSKDDLPRPGFRQFILLPSLELLRQRIRQRTEMMLAQGWIDETRRLLAAGLEQAPTARQALGYPEIAEYLHQAGTDQEALLERLTLRTVQYARRQRTWFRHQHPGATLLEFAEETAVADLAERVLTIAN
jgi:tRNA dimethylallyltransferase